MMLYRLLVMIMLLLSGCTTTSSYKPSVTPNNHLQTAALNVQLGVDYLQQGQAELAKPKLLLALQQAPNWPPALNAMAYYLEKTGDNTAAEKYYLQALRVNPNDGSAHNNYGTFLCRGKNYSAALQHFELAVRDPNYLNPANAYENAGLCAVESGNLVAAQHYFKQALVQNPKRLQALLGLAQLAYQRQDYSLAQHYLLNYRTAGGAEPEAQILADNLTAKPPIPDKSAGGRH